MRVWYTSDSHLGHDNIRAYCERPFSSCREMDEYLIEKWNEAVKPEDTIYHIGDFAFGGFHNIVYYLKKLNGKKILIKGNHDRSIQSMLKAGFDEVYSEKIEVIQGLTVEFRHKPRPCAVDLQICGHIHRHFKVKGNIVNAGCDVWDFRPITFEQIVETWRESVSKEA